MCHQGARQDITANDDLIFVSFSAHLKHLLEAPGRIRLRRPCQRC